MSARAERNESDGKPWIIYASRERDRKNATRAREKSELSCGVDGEAAECDLARSLLVGAILWLASIATGVGPEQPRRELPDQLAFSVIPIVIGYIVAHYLSYFVEIGTQTLIQFSDPMSNGSNLFGTGTLAVPYWLSYHPTFLATCKVIAVVLGHVVAVLAAHERSIKLLPRRHQITGQLPLLVAMICFTVGGLYLLFSS